MKDLDLTQNKVLLVVTTMAPTDGFWYKLAIFEEIKDSDVKYPSQVSDAVDKLMRQGYLQSGNDVSDKRKSVRITFWGLLKGLSYFFRINPVTDTKVLNSLTDIFDFNGMLIEVLYETWPLFSDEIQKKIADRIREYAYDPQEGLSRSNLIDIFRCNLTNWQREQPGSAKILPDFEAKMVSTARTEFLDFIFFEPILRSSKDNILRSKETEKENMLLLHRNLRQKQDEFRSKTEFYPFFSKAIDDFLETKEENISIPKKIGKIKKSGTKRSAYQAWIALTVILMLEPTEPFVIRGESLKRPEKTIVFSRNGLKGNTPNLIFYSNNIKASVGFRFGMSKHLGSQPTIMIGKSQNREDLIILRDPVILIESEEETGWAKSGKGGIYLEYELNKELDIIPLGLRQEDKLIEYFVRQHNRKSSLFVICWKKEKGSKSFFRRPRITILEDVGFNQKSLFQIIEALAHMTNN